MNEIIRSLTNESHWSYTVSFIDNLVEKNGKVLCDLIRGRKALIVTTPTVYRLYGQALENALRENGKPSPVTVIKIQEATKTIACAEAVCRTIKNLDLDRKSLLVGLGGGVCTDIVTVAASWYRRGIPYLKIPTTLIGQVDAGIGIKGTLNFDGKKSYLGCFYPPEHVLIDTSFLKTLPQNHVRYGFAEIFKMGLVISGELLDLLDRTALSLIASHFQTEKETARRILSIAIETMLAELEENFYEDKTQKRLADMGHSISQELESQSNFALTHGETVAIDMALCCVIAWQKGILTEEICDRLLELLFRMGLPLDHDLLTLALCQKALIDVEKNRGHMNLVVPSGWGEATFIEERADLPNDILVQSIARLRQKNEALLMANTREKDSYATRC